MNNREIEKIHFAVFVIDALSKDWNKPTDEVYKTLHEVDLIENYILECYDVLHTIGIEAIVFDINDKLSMVRGK